MNALGLSSVVQDQEQVGSFAIQNVGNLTRVPYPDITGPLFRGFSYEYVAGQPAPILEEKVYNLTCPLDVKNLDSIPSPGQLDASVDTIIWYLVGITVGTIVFSILLIILLSLPVILDKTSNVQNFVATKYRKYKGKVLGSTPMDAEAGEAAGPDLMDDDDVAPGREGIEDYDGLSKVTNMNSSISMDSQTSTKSGYILSVETVLTPGQLKRLIVWGGFASALFVAGITLAAIGINAMFNTSILTVVRDRLNQESLVNTLNWLVTGLTIFIIVIDCLMTMVIFMFQDSRIRIWKERTIWNPLGGRKWFMSRALTFLSIIVGLIAMIIAICAVLFSFGLIVTIVQLVARIGCNELFNIEAFGQSAQSVCLNIPTLGINDVCGWEALQTCGEVTNMSVRNLLIGSMLLLWCHTVWMVVILAVLETYRTHELKVARQAKALGLERRYLQGQTERSIPIDS